MQKEMMWALLLCLMGWGTVLAQEIPSQQYDLAMAKGVHLLDEKQYEEAIAVFQEALVAKPKDRQAIYSIGVAQRLSGQYEAAYTTLKQVDTSFEKVHFDLGVAAYHTKRYNESVAEFSLAEPLSEESPTRQATIHYYLGLNDLQLKRFSEAATQFVRAIPLSAELATGGYYHAGVAYYRQKIWDEAKDAFNEVIEMSPDSAMAQSARAFLKEIEIAATKENVAKGKRWNFLTSFAIQSDSNVVLLPADAPLPNGIANQSDIRAVVVLQGGFTFFERSRFTGVAQYQIYQSLHKELNQFNVQSHDLGLILKRQPFDFAYHFSDARVDSNNYLQTNLLQVAIDLIKNPIRTTRFEYRFSDKQFVNSIAFPNNSDRTGTNNALGASFTQTVSDNGVKVNVGYTVDKESARADDWDYLGHRADLSVRAPSAIFRDFFEPSLKIEGTVRLYDNPSSSSSTQEKRKDQIQTYTLTFTHTFKKGLSGSLSYQHNQNGSNINDFDYQRETVSINAIATF
ncbi:MAG: tetratricopeptide repeat protein [Nitrospirae bacterium]|nr:tetratricopeptide repeat protein [Candidatus Troglogloeales bacterium]